MTAKTPASVKKHNQWRRALLVAAAFAVSGFGAAEIGARAFGVDDFPIYQADQHANYILAPNQSGAFLGKYPYAVNANSMVTAEKFPANGNGILLVGDSVVLGGNQISLDNRMGALLARATDCKVWPLAASSWAMANQLDYLLAHPDLLKVETIIFVSNDGDFGEKSLWQNDLMQPTRKPALASVFALIKYFYKPAQLPRFFDDRPNASHWQPQLVSLRKKFNGRIILVGYPDKKDVEGGRFDKFDISTVPTLPEVLASGQIEYVSVLGRPDWTTDMYDGEIHPRPDAYADLVKLIEPSLSKCSQSAAPVYNS